MRIKVGEDDKGSITQKLPDKIRHVGKLIIVTRIQNLYARQAFRLQKTQQTGTPFHQVDIV